MTASYGQHSAHGVGTTEYATRAASLLGLHISAILSKRALFLTMILVVNYSEHKLSVP